MTMYVVRVSYIESDITVICPMATQEDAMNFAYDMAKKKFHYYDMPKTLNDMMIDGIGFIEVLADDAELFLPTNMEVYDK